MIKMKQIKAQEYNITSFDFEKDGRSQNIISSLSCEKANDILALAKSIDDLNLGKTDLEILSEVVQFLRAKRKISAQTPE